MNYFFHGQFLLIYRFVTRSDGHSKGPTYIDEAQKKLSIFHIAPPHIMTNIIFELLKSAKMVTSEVNPKYLKYSPKRKTRSFFVKSFLDSIIPLLRVTFMLLTFITTKIIFHLRNSIVS